MISEFDKLKKDIKNFNETLKINGRCITFFGSARFDENDKYSQKARELARLLAPKFTIFTGALWRLQTAVLVRLEQNRSE